MAGRFGRNARLERIAGRSRREALKARGVKDRIQHRRTRGQPALPHWQTTRNKLIGRIRSAVERTFIVRPYVR